MGCSEKQTTWNSAVSLGLTSCLAWLQVGVSFPLHRSHFGITPMESKGDPNLKLVQMTWNHFLCILVNKVMHFQNLLVIHREIIHFSDFSQHILDVEWDWKVHHLNYPLNITNLPFLAAQLTGTSLCHSPLRCTKCLGAAAAVNRAWVSPCSEGEKGKMQRGISFHYLT